MESIAAFTFTIGLFFKVVCQILGSVNIMMVNHAPRGNFDVEQIISWNKNQEETC